MSIIMSSSYSASFSIMSPKYFICLSASLLGETSWLILGGESLDYVFSETIEFLIVGDCGGL